MLRKIVSTLLAISMMTSFINIVSAEETVHLMYETFDNYTGGKIDDWDKVSGSTHYSVANFGDSHGNCLAIESSETSSIEARYRFDKTYTEENIYHISLYTRCSLTEGLVILNLLDEENNPYRTIKAGEDVQIYTGDGATSFTQLILDEYTADAWYKFDIWLDMERDKISYIMTDKYGNTYDFATVCSEFDPIQKKQYTTQQKDGIITSRCKQNHRF